MAVVQSLVRAPSNEVYQGMHSSATGRRKVRVAQIVMLMAAVVVGVAGM